MTHPKLVAEKRTVLGKKVKLLRRKGLLPANVYGKGLESTAVEVKTADFSSLFKEVGETGLIDLVFDGQTRPVLVKNLQINHRENLLLHVDFYQVNLAEKVKTMVPLVIVGEAKAVTEKLGILLQNINEVEVEALPEDLPENIEVSVEHLANLDEQISVEELKAPTGAVILTDPTQIIVKIAELVTKEAEEEAAAEAAATEEAAAEAEATEGETPAEGEEKTEGKPENDASEKKEEEKS